MNFSQKYEKELSYIDSFWDKVTVKPKRRDKITNLVLKRAEKQTHKNILHIPNSFIVPNQSKFTHIFYWDSYFMFQGLIGTKREWIVKSMVENFIFLYKKYGVVPNFNSPGATNRSQPPFLSSMILDAYKGFIREQDKRHVIKKILSEVREDPDAWLRRVAKTAEKEYFHVWMDPGKLFHHSVPNIPLNRYGDRDVGYAHSSELESGWDFTSRFYNRCDEFLPIDLNTYLYKYECDFAEIRKFLKEPRKEWLSRARQRREQINKYMWNEKKGFFFDYSYVQKKQSSFLSLAGFTPLWAGLATKKQARKMVKMLPNFETNFGLLITAKESLPPKIDFSQIPSKYRTAVQKLMDPKQWDYPHIWPPLEYLTIAGLLRYGYTTEASRIMKKSLKAHSKIFNEYGTFFEKIDGVRGDVAKSFHYPNQGGFGWTNAIFYKYVEILDSL